MSFPAALPHGELEQISDDVYTVQGSFRMAPGVVIARTMTVVRVGDELALISAIRLNDDAPLDALGRVRHVVKLGAHGFDDPYYVDRYGAELWCLDGAKAVPEEHRTLGSDCPIPGAKLCVLPGVNSWPEAAMWLPNGGGTLITVDAIQNCAKSNGVSFMARLVTPFLGFKGGVIITKVWRKNQKVDPSRLREVFKSVSALEFDTLIPGHGAPVVGNASAQVAAALDAVAPR